MKKIKSFILATLAFALVAPTFTSCKKDDDNNNTDNLQIVQNIMSEFSVNDKMVADQKKASGKNEAVLLVAFGSTWNNAFLAFDKTKKAYETAFPNADVYVSFSSDICINRASVGENKDDNGNIVKRNYYEPRYLLHAIGAAKYDKIYVQSLQVIPGEEFAAVVASVKKFMNNGYIANAHLDDAYLAKLAETESIFLGMPLLSDSIDDVNKVAKELNDIYASEAQNGVVAFMGHGNPDKYDTFKANVRYTQLEKALQKLNPNSNYFVGTVDMTDNFKQDVLKRINDKGVNGGKIYLHALMSIAGDHAHNDMAGGALEGQDEDDYWGNEETEDDSWYEFFLHNGFTPEVPLAGKHPQGLLELPAIQRVWIEHTLNAEYLEDAYHSMYPEE